MALLVMREILALFVDIMSTDHKYSLCNKENLQQSIQVQLSKKQRPFSGFSSLFLKSTSNFESFEKSITLTADQFLKLRTGKDVAR